ncbi:MAG TPA: response regulator [Clostridia bacterium]|nr:response regulator [Clostridia bacterium]
MYKTLVVDDEKMIRNGIKKLIPWQQIGIDKVFTASSGVEALPIIKSEKPDIMLTDICMAEMDGLTLIEQVNQINPNTKILVLTGYDNFEYAQKCCKMKVQDFILKPVDENYLINAIKEQIKILEEDKKNLNNQKVMSRIEGITEQIKIEGTMRDLLHGRVKAEEMDSFYREYNYNKDQTMQIATVLPATKDDIKWRGHDDLLNISVKNMCIERFDYLRQGITFEDDDGRIIIAIFSSRDFDEVIERVEHLKSLMEDELDIYPKVILGSLVRGFGGINISYNDVLYLLQNCDESYKDIIQLHGTEQRLVIFGEVFQELKKIMNNNIGQPHDVMNAYSAFEKATKSYNLSNSLVRRYCFDMASSLYLNYVGNTDANLDNRLTSLLNSLLNSNAEDARKVTKGFIGQLVSQDDKDIHELVSVAKRYINDNIAEDLSVSSIAENLYITPNYFSRLFKKETGEGCNDYIVRKRMEKAKSLLEITNIKTGKIAMMVGYCDINYFSLSFKRNTGMSPTEYRKEYREV